MWKRQIMEKMNSDIVKLTYKEGKGEANTRAHGLNQAWKTELMTLDFEKRRKSGVPYGYLKYGAKANTSAHGLNEAWINDP
jgi:hypothetical protein